MPPTPSSTQQLSQQFNLFDVELIRRLAYDFYEQRGKLNGHDLDDWLQAEAELNLQAFLADTFSRLVSQCIDLVERRSHGNGVTR
ncbi:MAG TPA: DUF2934 domain-containing protein [Terriglobales bacterium]|jgi:hypothetical protein|nr:DUF2934 domain-containing protein [Terriglobales bacterium]